MWCLVIVNNCILSYNTVNEEYVANLNVLICKKRCISFYLHDFNSNLFHEILFKNKIILNHDVKYINAE